MFMTQSTFFEKMKNTNKILKILLGGVSICFVISVSIAIYYGLQIEANGCKLYIRMNFFNYYAVGRDSWVFLIYFLEKILQFQQNNSNSVRVNWKIRYLIKFVILNFNRYRRGLETCTQAKRSKSGHAILFSFLTRPSDEYNSAPSRKYSRPLLDVFACIG